MSIKIDGIEKVIASLDKYADTTNVSQAVKKGCAIVEGAAKKKAPKESGALRNSITYEVHGTEGVVFTPLEYAPYVEFGTGLFAEKGGRKDVPWKYKADDGTWHQTSGMHPQPFMRPAVNENRERILRTIKEGLSK
jgi:HK97 gp10 family phage protein